MYKTATYVYNQYYTLFMKYWNHMTPSQYFTILVLIAVAGWLLMRSSLKRT
jgi:hypothetical protein